MEQDLVEDRNASDLNVMVVTPAAATGQGGIDRIMASLKEELQRTPRKGLAASFHASRGNGSILLSPFHMAALIARMVVARLSGKVDVVHVNLSSHGSTYRKMIICAAARGLGIPYVVHLHGSRYMAFWSDRDTFRNRQIRRMFEKSAATIVLGTAWQEFLLRKAPGSAERLVVVPNATKAPEIAQIGGGDSVHILFLGRVDQRKGVPQLVEALAAMRGMPGWRATIAGDGEVDALRERVLSLGLEDRIAVPGWQGPQDVSRLLREADILTLPSFAENLPISIIEGMAHGLGIVATPVGAVEDIITDGESGLLVPPGDPLALRSALARLVEDGEQRRRLGDAARATHRERLDIGGYAETMANLWAKVSHSRSRR